MGNQSEQPENDTGATKKEIPSVRCQIINGTQRALPIVLSYIPIGFTYGVVAKQSGLAAYNIILMSVMVFAGSSQFIAVEMLKGGVGAIAIIATVFVVNLRQMLMAASLSSRMSKWSRGQLAIFSAEITDETFAMNSGKAQELNDCKAEAFTLNAVSHLSWIVGSLLGVFASGLIPDIKLYGLDFALAGMFIGLIVLQVNTPVKFVTAVLAGLFGTVLYCYGLQQSYIIVATVVAATLGLVFELWYKKWNRR